MINSVTFSLTEIQFSQLRAHLFPGDGNEAAAIALCGHAVYDGRVRLLAHEIILIPYAACTRRTPLNVTWPAQFISQHLDKARARKLSVVKIHSHPTGFPNFSEADDKSDSALFPSIHGLIDGALHHASIVMLPNARMFGRLVDENGRFQPLARISVVGDSIQIFSSAADDQLTNNSVLDTTRKGSMLFGAQMTAELGRYSVAVVGCSGIGSIVAELLARHGFGRIVLIDPDIVEMKNLGRILNSFPTDVGKPKVEVASNAIQKLNFGTRVEAINEDISSPRAVRAAASCDFVFGCMDSLSGRSLLNRLATFYLLPYVDLGVRIDVDTSGFVEQVCGAIRYMRPDGSSLVSRGVFSYEEAQADAVRRKDPERYEQLKKERYIRGVVEEQPAVLALNMSIAPLGVLELLARLYRFRDDPNSRYATTSLSLTQMGLYHDPEGAACSVLKRFVGRGEVSPLLDLPELS